MQFFNIFGWLHFVRTLLHLPLKLNRMLALLHIGQSVDCTNKPSWLCSQLIKTQFPSSCCHLGLLHISSSISFASHVCPEGIIGIVSSPSATRVLKSLQPLKFPCQSFLTIWTSIHPLQLQQSVHVLLL